ncbi:MAG: exodeoxyribonuclease VII small subunit [Clostridia bacterium]|nr:exodeoxyribonuclease VII small subunit [Clostridia bacterium]
MEEQNFEQVMEMLEKTVKELEEGNLDLETSIKKFEEGMTLSKKCTDILNEAEKKITILTTKENDEFEEENFGG